MDELILLARTRSLRKAHATLQELRLRSATSSAMGFAEPQAEFARPGRVALISGTPNQVKLWQQQLSKQLGGQIRILDPGEALALSDAEQSPDVFVIPGNLRRPDEGLRLLSELRSASATRYSSVIMVLRPQAQQQAVLALDMGANDLLYEGFSPRELALRIKAQMRLKKYTDRLRRHVDEELKLAAIDPLSGLFNRRYAFSHLRRIADHTARTGRSFAVMVLDIDRFKTVNDTFGHAAGDQAIKEVANRLKHHLRAEDLLARIGGEEFLIVLSDATLQEAEQVSERLRHAVECAPVNERSSGATIAITVSIGVTLGDAKADVDTLLLQADRALYKAKNNGRNRVSFDPVICH